MFPRLVSCMLVGYVSSWKEFFLYWFDWEIEKSTLQQEEQKQSKL